MFKTNRISTIASATFLLVTVIALQGLSAAALVQAQPLPAECASAYYAASDGDRFAFAQVNIPPTGIYTGSDCFFTRYYSASDGDRFAYPVSADPVR